MKRYIQISGCFTVLSWLYFYIFQLNGTILEMFFSQTQKWAIISECYLVRVFIISLKPVKALLSRCFYGTALKVSL